MAQLNYTVDPNNLPDNNFDLLPAGEYTVIIEDSDYKPNSKGTGKNLRLVYQVIEGKGKGRKLFNNLCLEHTSSDAVQIARRTLNQIGVAIGVTQITDSSLLHNKPMKIEVGIKKSDKIEYEKQNYIKKHLPFSGNAPVQTNTEEKTDKHPWED